MFLLSVGEKMIRFDNIMKKITKSTQIALQIKNCVEVYQHILFGTPLNKLNLRNGMVIYSPVEGVQLWNHFNDIWLYHTYTVGGYDIRNTDVVIDIGANIGLFSMYAAQYAQQVYSLEPFPTSFDYLYKNIEENDLKNVTCLQQAVGHINAKRPLFSFPESTGNSLFRKKNDDTNPEREQLMVECIKLSTLFDNLNITMCDFLKLDCEGCEFEILFNTPKVYFDRIKHISLECHEDSTDYSCFDLMQELKRQGFDVSVSLNRANTSIIKAKNLRFET